jgi:hypothetical protein
MQTDIYHLCKLITAMFLIGLFLCGKKLLKISSYHDSFNNGIITGFHTDYAQNIKKPDIDKSLMANSLTTNVFSYISIVNKFIGYLVLLGLLGTVFGVMIAFLGFDLSTVGDISSLASSSVSLVQGVKIALYTTMLGSIYSLWLSLCYHILERFSYTYVQEVIVFGECGV